MYNIHEYCELFGTITAESSPNDINGNLKALTKTINVDAIPVADRVILSSHILKNLSREQRM